MTNYRYFLNDTKFPQKYTIGIVNGIINPQVRSGDISCLDLTVERNYWTECTSHKVGVQLKKIYVYVPFHPNINNPFIESDIDVQIGDRLILKLSSSDDVQKLTFPGGILRFIKMMTHAN